MSIVFPLSKSRMTPASLLSFSWRWCLAREDGSFGGVTQFFWVSPVCTCYSTFVWFSSIHLLYLHWKKKFFVCGHSCGIQKLLDHGLNPPHSSHQRSRCRDNAKSLAQCTMKELLVSVSFSDQPEEPREGSKQLSFSLIFSWHLFGIWVGFVFIFVYHSTP